ncbi:MAG: hypothetical protein JW867_05455 [Candidatus Omnitrophica bacterium]|nr:hypothetical protein [Candidatus Omnitrophota bacterium]
MKKKHKAQAALYYAILIVFVAVALFAMSGYLRRRIMGTYKGAGDAYGEGEQAVW